MGALGGRRRGREKPAATRTKGSRRTFDAIDRLFLLPFLLSLEMKILPPIDLPFDVGARGQVRVERLEAFGGGESGERDHCLGELRKRKKQRSGEAAAARNF